SSVLFHLTAPPAIRPLSLHDALPICFLEGWRIYHDVHVERGSAMRRPVTTQFVKLVEPDGSNLVSVLHTLYTSNLDFKRQINERSEEHSSELQSPDHLVCRLLLEKKK